MKYYFKLHKSNFSIDFVSKWGQWFFITYWCTYWWKKSLNRLAFLQKSEKHLPLISKGGMVGNFRYIKNGLILASMF